jgi:hypothetical protein
VSGYFWLSVYDRNNSRMWVGLYFTLISKICAALFPRLAEQWPERAHIPNPV